MATSELTSSLADMDTEVNVTATTTNLNSSIDVLTEYYDYEISDSIPLTESLALIFAYSLTLLLGLVGNSLVIFSIAYYRRMRTTTNVFLFSLASADLLLVLICVPVKAALLLTFHWVFGEVICKLVFYVQNVSMICSVLTLTCISLERVIAVVLPLKARTICTNRHAKIVVILVWNISVLLATPIIFGMKHQEVGDRIKAHWCIKSFSTNYLTILYEMYMFLLMFIIPIVVMVTSYFIICLKVWKFMDMRTDMRHGRVIAPTSRDRIRQDINSHDSLLLNSSAEGEIRQCRAGRNNNAEREDTKTTKQLVVMLVVVVVFFAVCWGPILINNVLTAFDILPTLNYEFLKPMRAAFYLMSYTNSCINPIVYAFLSKNFRQSFKFAICACVKGKAFIRAYRFSMSIASTRTSAVSNGKRGPRSAGNRDKSSSSDNNCTQQTNTHQVDDIIELRPLPQYN